MKKLSIIFTVAIAMLFVSNPAFAADGVSKVAGAGDAGWVAGNIGTDFMKALNTHCTHRTTERRRRRNPNAKLQTPMIIAMALTESLVILAFIIAYGLSGKI